METYQMVAKTFQGLEEILAEELRGLGALNVEPGRRMVSFEGDKAMMYRANLCCRTALRILKPIATFEATDPDELYDEVKRLPWENLLTTEKTFSIDPVVYSEYFNNSRYVTYRVKDAIVDRFQDRLGYGKRPGVRLDGADIMLNVHISGKNVTLSLDSSGESLHKRGYRVASTEAPINEVLAAGIILRSGWRGDEPFVDPMCGSGTFPVEAALIAGNIMPGVYRRGFAFEQWDDFDRELFESIYNDDSGEREIKCGIYGADISPKAVEAATQNLKSAGVAKYVTLERKALSQWESAPEDKPGVIVTNPPYGERLKVEDMEGLYRLIGSKLKNVFEGYHAWIIGYREEYFQSIGLAPSTKMEVLNGSLECQLREYILFKGDYRAFKAGGGKLKTADRKEDRDKTKKEKKERRYGEKRRDFKDFKKGRFDERTKGKEPEEGEESRHRKIHKAHGEDYLKNFKAKQPTLPAPDGPFMRIRRGWKRPGDQEEENKD